LGSEEKGIKGISTYSGVPISILLLEERLTIQMIRFWVEFSAGKIGNPQLSPRYGVTAHTYEEAMELLGERVFTGKVLPEPVKVTADIDVSALDPKHILPNIGSPANFGIWYPKGFNWMR
jgi:hypothetical protein